MKIDCKKINKDARKFSLSFINDSDSVVFSGNIYRITNNIFKMDAIIKGGITLVCDLSGDNFLKELDEEIYLLFKNGLWKGDELDKGRYSNYDVIEIFDNYIDLDYILYSEVESIRLDYHIKI